MRITKFQYFNLVFILAGVFLFGQETSTDLDSMFDDSVVEEDEDQASDKTNDAINFDDMFEEAIIEDKDGQEIFPDTETIPLFDNPQDRLLKDEDVNWGGNFTFSPTVNLSFPSYSAFTGGLSGGASANRVFSNNLESELFFDARPSTDFRVFGKSKFQYNGSGFDFKIFELFSDFHWEDSIFFRAGKQRADWGVGRFFSPADLVSLATINPLDPTLEREGPVALKIHAPLDINNIYFYLLSNEVTDPLAMSVGIRGEAVIGNYEIGFGGMYQKDLIPRGILTFTGPLEAIDLFGEMVIQKGTERNKIVLEETELFGKIIKTISPVHSSERTEWYLAATIGASYVENEENIFFSAQYYYNPLGYENSDGLWQAQIALLADTSFNGGPDGTFNLKGPDLVYFGQHNFAASVLWNEILDSKLNFSTFWVSNLSDNSGLVRANFSYSLFDEVRLSFGTTVGYGVFDTDFLTGSTTEYRENVNFSLNASLGSGRF